MPLSKKQSIVFNAIKIYFSRNRKMPTVRELKAECANLGVYFKSVRSIFLLLKKLEDQGLIKRTGQERGIELLNKKNSLSNLIDIPIFGTANAGAPSAFADQHIEGYLKISNELVNNKKLFAIKVSGSSMDRTQIKGKIINDGDFILINPEDKNFQDNDRVLVSVGGLATVKKLKFINKDMIGLFPESSDKTYVPIYITSKDKAIINGKVIDVFPASEDFLSNGDDLIYEEIME
ncbi:hypothetical protein KKE99_01710 [Patescibacteria group bacterium]|nr:hypothetical protein [Patescibacteria group bacterium]